MSFFRRNRKKDDPSTKSTKPGKSKGKSTTGELTAQGEVAQAVKDGPSTSAGINVPANGGASPALQVDPATASGAEKTPLADSKPDAPRDIRDAIATVEAKQVTPSSAPAAEELPDIIIPVPVTKPLDPSAIGMHDPIINVKPAERDSIATAPLPELSIFDRDTSQSSVDLDTPRSPMPVPMPIAPPPLQFDGFPGGTRQLSPVELYTTKPGKHLSYGLNSDIGMVRNNNQDSCFTMVCSNISSEDLPEFGLFVVADGMGGHHDGEKASAITTRTISQYLLENFYMKILAGGEDRPIIGEVLMNAIHAANDQVAEHVPEGGTTVTATAIVGGLAYVAHVGDSRAYLIAGEGLEQITRDHSLVQRLIELDQITPEEAATHPQRNVLYRALGQSEVIEVDSLTRRLPAGAKILLCSDGLWGLVPEPTMLQIIQTSKSVQDACDRLVTAANERGGPDNITAVIVQIPG